MYRTCFELLDRETYFVYLHNIPPSYEDLLTAIWHCNYDIAWPFAMYNSNWKHHTDEDFEFGFSELRHVSLHHRPRTTS